MSATYIPAALRQLVEARARNRCEYCCLPANVAFFPHEIDHVIAEKHGGLTNANNLAYFCWRCNRHKGIDLGSFDPETGDFSFLFNSRSQNWEDYFAIQDGEIIGLKPEGRTTVWLLQLNTQERIAERRRLFG